MRERVIGEIKLYRLRLIEGEGGRRDRVDRDKKRVVREIRRVGVCEIVVRLIQREVREIKSDMERLVEARGRGRVRDRVSQVR